MKYRPPRSGDETPSSFGRGEARPAPPPGKLRDAEAARKAMAGSREPPPTPASSGASDRHVAARKQRRRGIGLQSWPRWCDAAGVRAAAIEVGGGEANGVVGVASPRWRMAGILVQAVAAAGEQHGLKLVCRRRPAKGSPLPLRSPCASCGGLVAFSGIRSWAST